MSLSIRELVDADLEKADALLKLAFRGPVSRLPDIQLYRRIQPDGWFAAFQEGKLVGTVGATSYQNFAYIGLMAVHPDSQHQGIGFAIMEFILDKLRKQNITEVILDASKTGRPLYEKLGFVAYDETVVCQHNSVLPTQEHLPNIQVISLEDLDELVEFDTPLFGANRRKIFEVLLDLFPGRAFAERDKQGQLTGYIFAQKERIGPWVMTHPNPSDDLFRTVLGLPCEGPISVVVPTENQGAATLLQRYGFEKTRINRHMGKGISTLPGQRQKIFAQTSLAVG